MKRFPKRLVAGVVISAAVAITNTTTDYGSMPQGERLGAGVAIAVMAAVGVGLALWGFVVWRRQSD